MYIFVNKGLGMSAPKLAGMVLQAGIRAYSDAVADPEKQKLLGAWLQGGMMKVVLNAEDTEQLHNIERYLSDHGFKTYAVVDEGRTEVREFSFTTMAVELVDKLDVRVLDTFSQFKTYKTERPEAVNRYYRKESWRDYVRRNAPFFSNRQWVEVVGPM